MRKTIFHNLVQPRSCENNFGRLRMVQTKVVCGSPVLNIFDFRDFDSCDFASYDQVCVPIELKILTGCRSNALTE